MSEKSTMSRVRKWSRTIHRDLSYLFAGALLVYAVSGICLNHKKDFNSDYIIRLEKYEAPQPLPAEKDGWTKEYVLGLLAPLDEQASYTKHYFPDANTMKVFLKGGSSLVVDIHSGQGHTNPSKNVLCSPRSTVCTITLRGRGLGFRMSLRPRWYSSPSPAW